MLPTPKRRAKPCRAKFIIVAPTTNNSVETLLGIINDHKDDRIPSLVRTCLLANKLARMFWAMMANGEFYKDPLALNH